MIRNFFLLLIVVLFSVVFTPQMAQAQCSQPSNLNVVNTNASSVVLSWSAAQGAASYTLQYRVQGTTTWTTATNILTTSRTLNNLLASTVYQYRVRASCSTYSSVAIFNTGGSGGNAACSQPSNLEATNVTLNSTTINWSEISGAFSYSVQYRVQGTSAWTLKANQTGVSTNITGLVANATYQFRVKASCSIYSSITTFTTANNGSNGGNGGGSTSCSAPSNTNVNAVTATTASVSWESVSGAASYLVEYRLENSATYVNVGTVTVASANIVGLTPGQQYAFRVKANCSPYGSDVQFSTPFTMMAKVETAVSMFPNPTTDGYVMFKATAGTTYTVLDLSGRTIQKGQMKESEQPVTLNELNNGIYFVHFAQPNGIKSTQKLQINR